MLIIVAVGLTCLLFVMQMHKTVILSLYFLPIALSGFFLGRYRAGVMALFCVIAASIVTAWTLPEMGATTSPLVTILGVTVWAATLGLTSLLVGTLSDDRNRKIDELHEAYVGVVEVLSQYLQSAHPRLKAQSIRVAELSQQVAERMDLASCEIDDICVAALLYDIGNIEITTKVIHKAVLHKAGGVFDADKSKLKPNHTFQGMDLMLSLGSVLSGAVPLLLNQDSNLSKARSTGAAEPSASVPVGARIIRATRAYDTLTEGPSGGEKLIPQDALKEMRSDQASPYYADVLKVLERIVFKSDSAVADSEATPSEPVTASVGSN